MSNPHNHMDVIQSLKDQAQEIKDMPKLQEPIEEDEGPAQEELSEETDYDLDSLLTELETKVQQAQQTQPREDPISAEENLRREILNTLHGHREAPSQDQIDAWKQKYGDHGVQVTAFDPENVYVYTYLTWNQWDKVQKLSQHLQQQQNVDVERQMRDAVLKTAILWPTINPSELEKKRAGIPNTMYELILLNSYFLTPQQAITLTTRI